MQEKMQISFKSETTIRIDNEYTTVHTINEMFDVLHIPNTEEYAEARVCILQKLLAFREIDLSDAYQGHTVVVTLRLFEE